MSNYYPFIIAYPLRGELNCVIWDSLTKKTVIALDRRIYFSRLWGYREVGSWIQEQLYDEE